MPDATSGAALIRLRSFYHIVLSKLAVILAAYLLASAAAALVAAVFSRHAGQSVLIGGQLGFAVFTLALILAFGYRNLTRAWLVMLAITALLMLPVVVLAIMTNVQQTGGL